MKRSDAIDEIWDYLMKNAQGMKMESKEFISKVIEGAESIGMKPSIDKEHFLEKVSTTIKEEHIHNHGYPIGTKRLYYAMRGAVLATETTWEKSDD